MLFELPASFTERVLELTVEFEAEYFVLEAIDDGGCETGSIRSFILSNVRSLSDGNKRAVADAITRFLDKQVIERDGGTLRPKTMESNSGVE